jgi:transcriptional regulator with XRE-family HTH domain
MRSIYSTKYRTLVKRLQDARRDAGLTQTEVAKAIGRPQSFVSKCEIGERRLDVIELSRLASLYRKTLDYFLGLGEEAGAASASLAHERKARYRASSKGAGSRRSSRGRS